MWNISFIIVNIWDFGGKGDVRKKIDRTVIDEVEDGDTKTKLAKGRLYSSEQIAELIAEGYKKPQQEKAKV